MISMHRIRVNVLSPIQSFRLGQIWIQIQIQMPYCISGYWFRLFHTIKDCLTPPKTALHMPAPYRDAQYLWKLWKVKMILNRHLFPVYINQWSFNISDWLSTEKYNEFWRGAEYATINASFKKLIILIWILIHATWFHSTNVYTNVQ